MSGEAILATPARPYMNHLTDAQKSARSRSLFAPDNTLTDEQAAPVHSGPPFFSFRAWPLTLERRRGRGTMGLGFPEPPPSRLEADPSARAKAHSRPHARYFDPCLSQARPICQKARR
jgi:hypothetical protein